MKMLLTIMLLVPLLAQAEKKEDPTTFDKQVTCVPTEMLFKALGDNDFKELPIWSGKENETTWGIVANEQTGTWTLIQFTEKIACIIGTGTKNSIADRYSS